MKTKVLFLLMFVLFSAVKTVGQEKSQKIVITGVVLDINQKPVYGATLVVDGEKTTRITDKKGKYKIKAKTTSEKIGILTIPQMLIEEQINGRSIVNFTLDTSIVKKISGLRDDCGEEEVNIGYGTEKRKNLSTSVSRIDARKERYASYNSIYGSRGSNGVIIISTYDPKKSKK